MADRLFRVIGAPVVTTLAGLVSLSSPAPAQSTPEVLWYGKGTNAAVMAVSPDGQTIATSNFLSETALKLWRTDGTFLRTIPSLSDFWSITFSPDGQYVLGGRYGIAGDDHATAEIYRVSDGAYIRGLNPGPDHNYLERVTSVAYSPSGNLAGVAYNWNTGIELYNPATGALVRTLPDAGWGVAFSPNGQMVAGRVDGGVRLWDPATGAPLRTITTDAVLLSFSRDSQYIATSIGDTYNSSVNIWRTGDAGLHRTIAPQRIQYPRSIAFSPTQDMLVIAGSRDTDVEFQTMLSDNVIEAYRLDGTLIWRYEHTYGIAFSIGFTPDGQTIMVAGGWRTPQNFYVEGGDDCIQRLRASDGVELGHFAGVRGASDCVTFSPDSTLFASAGTQAQIWRVANGTVEHTFEHGGASIDFSQDDARICIALGVIPIYTRPDYVLERVLPGHAPNGTNQALFSRQSDLIASGGNDTRVKLWRVSDGALLWNNLSGAGAVYSVAFSPDGQFVAAGCNASTVRIYRVADGSLVRSIFGVNAVDQIAWSHDGTMIAVAEEDYGDNLKLYRASDGSLLRAFAGSPWGFAKQDVCFTPDDSTLVFAAGVETIQFWRISDGALLHEYTAELGTGPFPKCPVAISPDSRYFGYGRQDHMVVMARNPEGPSCGTADFNHDGDSGTDQDIEAFFSCIAGNCCPACGSADFDGDGDTATDADIEAFFRVLAGGTC